jgi:hypothetical protein
MSKRVYLVQICEFHVTLPWQASDHVVRGVPTQLFRYLLELEAHKDQSDQDAQLEFSQVAA